MEEAKTIEGVAATTSGVTKAAFLLCFVICVALTKSLLPIWALFNTLQILVHLPLVNVPMPGNATAFLKGLLDIARLEVFNVRPWIKDWLRYPDGLDGLNAIFNDYGYDSKAAIVNLGVLTGLLFLGVLALIIAALVDQISNKVLFAKNNRTHPDLPDKTTATWAVATQNAFLRFGFEVFLEFFLCALINVVSMGSTGVGSSIYSCAIILTLLAVSALPLVLFFTGGPDEDTEEVNPRYATTYLGLNKKHSLNATTYPAYFLWRRIFFALTVVLLAHRPIAQIFLLAVQSVGMLAILTRFVPFEDTWFNRL